MKIALLGAESTGKTRLSRDLAAHFAAQGRRVALVGEYLREWCAAQGRTPRPEEQLAIAQEQERRVDEAEKAASGAGGDAVVIADTTAVMVAIYSAMLFKDGTLYRFALERMRGYDVTLVTGLDLPWVADGLMRDGPHVREPVDALVRDALRQAGVPYRVVYGQGAERLANALFAIDSIAPQASLERLAARSGTQSRPWACERCADPDCEHRLFTGLLDSPEAGPRAR